MKLVSLARSDPRVCSKRSTKERKREEKATLEVHSAKKVNLTFRLRGNLKTTFNGTHFAGFSYSPLNNLILPLNYDVIGKPAQT